MFHPHFQRVIVLVAGILFLAYAISTDQETDKRTQRDDADDDGDTEPGGDETGEIANVVDAASEAGQFGTWSLAVRQAGLVAQLEGEGPFTIFAPTDDAFSKLGESLDELLADPAGLRATIEGHIVEGKLTSADLAGGTALTTLAGTSLHVSVDGDVKINDSTVVESDLTASNGVIHGIDAVIPTTAAGA